jgi:hypothetical protein
MVTETTFQNMIRFAFHFNRHMGNKVEDMDATYILEKWNAYFGDSVPPVPTTDFLEQYVASLWCQRWSNFERVAGHIQLIQRMNTKLTPQRILEVFEGTQWDDNRNSVYENLHPNVRQVMDGWLSAHNKEMKQVLREIRLDALTSK